VLDLERAVDHYQRLGFTTEYHDETYGFARWGNLVIHLVRDEHPTAHMTSELYILSTTPTNSPPTGVRRA
jgi:hypothetical protein